DEEEEDEEEGEDDEDDEEDWGLISSLRPVHTGLRWKGPVHTEPQKAGTELLNSGDFGAVGGKARKQRHDIDLAKRILNRARQPHPRANKEELASNLIPNSNGTIVASGDSNIYTGQYSADSSFYYTCSQDFRLHVFDTTKPPIPYGPRGESSLRGDSSLKTTMMIRKAIQGRHGQWTITDANLSPDNERTGWDRGGNFGIWSCRFSADGNEVVAGGSGNIFVYDLIADRRTVSIAAHRDDVNSCCWADTASGNVLVSASDDSFLKVWDRRSLGASQKPSGVLMGHTEGITYVSAKGDGRYLVSNGKDQAMRLWDLRKMRSNKELEAVHYHNYGVDGFDYRYPPYPGPKLAAHPKDCSVMTYYGHSVMRTLIRCHFSPMETTGAQYLYSGSADGRIHIWSLDGRVVQVLDRNKTRPMSFDPSEPELPPGRSRSKGPCVRDVSWHSQEPVMMSAAWGYQDSTVARHEWKGLLKMRGALEDWVEKDRQEEVEMSRQRRSSRLAARRHVPGAFDEEDEEDEEDTE
ncbi:hypothetical protein H0H92_014037, partial [Tricholoma furcatifolium]